MQVDRARVYTGTRWEKEVAYCRAVRAGSFVLVAGTVAADGEGRLVGEGDVYAQAGFIFAKIERALGQLGAELRDVVRTRTYLVDMAQFDDFARAHGETFAGIDPVATCVGVSGLVGEGFLVEIEVDAVVP